MVSIIFTISLSLLISALLYFSMLQPGLQQTHKLQKTNDSVINILVLLGVGLIFRYIGASVFRGHETDMNCFSAWSDMIFNNGFSKFYASDTFTDYPPGYMYVLYIIGAIRKFIPMSQTAINMLIKTPAILCDIASAYIVYALSKKRFSENIALMLSGFYLFNPAVYINSALWGQVDSVFTLLALAMTFFVAEKKMPAAYFLFAAGILMKPQMLIFTPLLIYGAIEVVFLPKFSKGLLVKNLLWGLGAILMLIVLSLPFGINYVIDQYIKTLSSYPYASVNAFNLWAALGQNWIKLNSATSVIGNVFIVLIVAASAYIFFKTKNPSKYYFTAAFLSISTYMLSTKMHDRYVFPAMVMLLAAFIAVSSIEMFFMYILVSLAQFFNAAYVLFIYQTEPNKYFNHPIVIVASFVNIAIYIFFLYNTNKLYVKNLFNASPLELSLSKQNKAKPQTAAIFERTKPLAKITRFDIAAITVITIVYSFIALYDLGDKEAPQTSYNLNQSGASIVLDLGSPTQIQKIKYFLGCYENREFTIDFSNSSDENFTNSSNLKMNSVFAWGSQDVNTSARYIRLTLKSDKLMLNELAIIDGENNKVIPVNSSDYPQLFDEQSLVPERSNFRNSTYFDEIYHARTGYEFVHSLTPYEWTHPPLGKVFIALGIKLFGMTPFGWRIVGTIFGILMIPIIYIFAKKITGATWLAAITCLLFTFDFMHFAQTRIATIDVYATFFIILMYLFMYRYFTMSFYDTKLSKTLLPLGLSGIAMGLGAASKWTGIYAGAGLGILFFITLYKRYSEYAYACRFPKNESFGIKHKHVIDTFKSSTLKTIMFCCIFFIVVPLIIYGLSYIPYLKADGMQGIKSIIENQRAMLTYHGKTVVSSTHPFSSRWYEWPIMKRPIWYYSGTITNDIKEGISSFGNPAVWWMGIFALLYMVVLAIREKDKTALFLVVGYFAQFVLWIPVTRITFIYHYFPCVPFLVLMIGYSILKLYENNKKWKYAAFGYTLLAIVLFAMFYPVLSGHPVSVSYVKTFLKWFSSWVLI